MKAMKFVLWQESHEVHEEFSCVLQAMNAMKKVRDEGGLPDDIYARADGH